MDLMLDGNFRRDVRIKMQEATGGVETKEVKLKDKTIKRAFTAKGAIDWLQSNKLVDNKQEATQLLNSLVEEGLVERVVSTDKAAKDLYCFEEEEDAPAVSVFGSESNLYEDIYHPSVDTAEKEESELSSLVEKMKSSSTLQIRDRLKGFKVYKQTFVASEAVDWLVKNRACPNRQEAVKICQKLILYNKMAQAIKVSSRVFTESSDLYMFTNRKDMSRARGTTRYSTVTSKSNLLEIFSTYLPQTLLRDIKRNHVPKGTEECQFISAVMFADVSGYTALTEKLAKEGAKGAEKLTIYLNDYFSKLIRIIYDFGGDVVKFAGDALLALWPTEEDESIEAKTLAAVQAGYQMISQAIFETPEGYQLSIHVGVGAGDVRSFVVGGQRSRWEYVVAGQGISQATAAADLALPGQLCVSQKAWEMIKKHGQGKRVGENKDIIRVRRLNASSGSRATSPTDVSKDMETGIRSFMPGAVIYSLQKAEDAAWLSQLRQLTILFINLPGIDYTQADVLSRLDDAMKTIQNEMYLQEGSVNKLLQDDKGTIILCACGIPPLFHDDDPVRAVQAAEAIVVSLECLGIPGRVGIATGLTYCGSYGSDFRREYAILGDNVNLAARLMQVATKKEPPYSILADENTYLAVKSRVSMKELPEPLKLKGKATPVKVFFPCSQAAKGPVRRERRLTMNTIRRASVFQETPLNVSGDIVGLDTEALVLEDKFQKLLTRFSAPKGEATDQAGLELSNEVIIIEGEPGMGKHSLINALSRRCAQLSINTLECAADEAQTNTPYFCWKKEIARLLGIHKLSEPQRSARAIEAFKSLGMNTEVELLPLFNSLLLIDKPETDETKKINGKVRQAKIKDMIIRVITKTNAKSPTVVILDEAHWLDPASWSLLSSIVTETNILTVISTRSVQAIPARYKYIADQPTTTRISLSKLNNSHILELLCSHISVQSMEDTVVHLVASKSTGNPCFAEELAFYLLDNNSIQISEKNCRVTPGVEIKAVMLPESLQRLLISRFDRLSPKLQQVLRSASIIGDKFTSSTLKEVCGEANIQPFLDQLIISRFLSKKEVELVQHSANPLEAGEAEIYSFKNKIMRELIYQAMLFSQKKKLHQSIAEYIEKKLSNNIKLYPQLLAFHYTQAERVDKMVEYLEKSADDCYHNYSVDSAIHFYNHLLSKTSDYKKHKDLTDIQISNWQKKLASLYMEKLDFKNAKKHLESSLKSLGTSTKFKSLNMQKLSSEVEKYLNMKLPAAGSMNSNTASTIHMIQMSSLESSLHQKLSLVHLHLGEYQACLENCLKALELNGGMIKIDEDTLICWAALGYVLLFFGAKQYSAAFFSYAIQKASSISTSYSVEQLYARFLMNIGDWNNASETLNKLLQSMKHEGIVSEVESTQILLMSCLFCSGSIENSVVVGFQANTSAKNRGAVYKVVLSVLIGVPPMLANGHHIDVIDRLEKIKDYLENHENPDDSSLSDVDLRFAFHAFKALACYRASEMSTAAEEVVSASSISSSNSFSFVLFESLTALTEVCYEFLTRSLVVKKEKERWMDAINNNLKKMKKWSEEIPICQPRYLLLKGMHVALVEGKAEKAEKDWKAAAEQFKKMGMQYDEGKTYFLLAKAFAQPGSSLASSGSSSNLHSSSSSSSLHSGSLTMIPTSTAAVAASGSSSALPSPNAASAGQQKQQLLQYHYVQQATKLLSQVSENAYELCLMQEIGIDEAAAAAGRSQSAALPSHHNSTSLPASQSLSSATGQNFSVSLERGSHSLSSATGKQMFSSETSAAGAGTPPIPLLSVNALGGSVASAASTSPRAPVSPARAGSQIISSPPVTTSATGSGSGISPRGSAVGEGKFTPNSLSDMKRSPRGLNLDNPYAKKK